MSAAMKAAKEQVFGLMYSLTDGSNQNLRATRSTHPPHIGHP